MIGPVGFKPLPKWPWTKEYMDRFRKNCQRVWEEHMRNKKNEQPIEDAKTRRRVYK